MPTLNLLYKDRYEINDKIKIIIPTVGEIIDDEDNYYSIVNIITAMPIDLMVQLDDAGIDFTEINEFELFVMMSAGLSEMDTSLIFDGLDLSKFTPATSPQNGKLILYNKEDDIVIDRAIHGRIADVLRKIHHLKKNLRKPGNKAAKEYMIERARAKLRRNKNRQQSSQLESFIVALVNTEQYKYDFEGTRNLSIYQFNECLMQIIKKEDYEHRMAGIYAGTIDAKDLSQDDLNWLIHK